MVKLFVGNLAETVDSVKLRQVFKPFTNITECDVVKNYAFITIPDEDQREVMTRMDGYVIEGKAIQIKLSTSKLRSQGSVPVGCCLRCGSGTHKTPQCPDDPKNLVKETIVIDLTRGAKRLADGSIAPVEAKRTAVMDQEIPQPPEPELQGLYEQYRDSRVRYEYFRDQLIKEIETKRGVGTAYMVFGNGAASTTSITQLSSAPVSYQADARTLPAYTPPTVTGSHPYATSTALKAPYGSPAASGSPIVPPVPSANTMTSQQFLQQQLAQKKVPVPLMSTPIAPPPPMAPLFSSTPPTAPYGTPPTATSNISWMQQQAMATSSEQSGSGVRLTIT